MLTRIRPGNNSCGFLVRIWGYLVGVVVPWEARCLAHGRPAVWTPRPGLDRFPCSSPCASLAHALGVGAGWWQWGGRGCRQPIVLVGRPDTAGATLLLKKALAAADPTFLAPTPKWGGLVARGSGSFSKTTMEYSAPPHAVALELSFQTSNPNSTTQIMGSCGFPNVRCPTTVSPNWLCPQGHISELFLKD